MFNTIGYKQKKKKSKMKTDSQNLTYRTESEIYGYKESRSVLQLRLFLKNPLSTWQTTALQTKKNKQINKEEIGK